MTPRALLVDYGGVLTLSLRSGMADACRRVGADPASFGEILKACPGNPMIEVETGRLDWGGFSAVLEAALVDAGGSDVDIEVFVGHLIDRCPPDELVCGAVARLRELGVPCALVSNSWSVDHYLPEIVGMFDVAIYSSTFGSRKPDREIYLAAARRLGVPPSDCVMVDDFPVNIAGAQRLGMTGILHERSEDTVAELGRLFGVDLTATARAPVPEDVVE